MTNKIELIPAIDIIIYGIWWLALYSPTIINNCGSPFSCGGCLRELDIKENEKTHYRIRYS